MFTTNNPLYFIFDVMKEYVDILNSSFFLGIPLFVWIIGFITTSFVISVFWKGA